MIRVDVSSNLKDESCKLRFIRLYFTFLRLHGTRTRSDFYETVEQLLHTEVIQCRAEEYRCCITFQIIFNIEFRINTFYQFQLATKLICQRCTDMAIQISRIHVNLYLFCYHLLRRLEKIQFLLIYIIYTLKTRSALDRPCKRTHVDNQFLF